MSTTSERKTAAQRRVEVLEAAIDAFAIGGYEGTSTEEIARRAGVSQPYVFRLFGSKHKLFVAAVERCYEHTLELMRAAANGYTGETARMAIGKAYVEWITQHATGVRFQLQSYLRSNDPDVRAVSRTGYGRLVAFVRDATDATDEQLYGFFSTGMMFNVIALLGLFEKPLPWSEQLLAGCGDPSQT